MLAAIVVISALPYVTKLSFYSDDWYILSVFQADVTQHRFGLGSAIRGFEARPVQGLYLAGLYALFGLQPLGYHLVNLLVITASVLLFHKVLIRLDFGRTMAMATALIFVALPQLSTVRVWVSAMQIPLSMLAALAAIHCQLSFVRSGKWPWLVGGAVSAVISVAAYEIFAPVIAMMALWSWLTGARAPRRRTVVALPALVVAAVMASKLLLSDRVPSGGLALYAKGLRQLARPDYDWRVDNGLNVFAAASVHFWWPIRGAARAFAALLKGELGIVAPAVSAAVALLSFFALRSIAQEPVDRGGQRLLLLGLAVFALGHAVFLVTPAMFFSPGGPSNRVLLAAALGVAMIIVAAVRALSDLLPATVREVAFAGAVSGLVFFGMLRMQEIEGHWVRAGAEEASIMRNAASDLGVVPTGAVVVLDNVCPYEGPAIVMEAPWDISGALSVAAGRTIRGDSGSARMSAEQSGISTSIYGEPAFYPYGRMLYAYDPMKRLLTPLPDRNAATSYFAAARIPCPEGFPGHGVLI